LYANTLNTTWFYNGLLNTINTYAQQVSYFDATTKLLFKLPHRQEIYPMRTLLGTDVTSDELAARGLSNNFNMRVGQSSLQSSQFFVNAAYPLTDKLELYALEEQPQNCEAAGFYRRKSI
jgi:iron complex outermembrane receptor protein